MAFLKACMCLNKTSNTLMGFLCIYVAKSGRLSYLCAYFLLQRLHVIIFEQKWLYVLMGHVLMKKLGV